MPCYKPLRAWRGIRDRAIYWREVNDSEQIALSCGQCIGCRLERSRQAAVRCMHEAKLHRYNSFLTLTLDDNHLTNRYWTGKYYKNGEPAYAGTLQPRDTQLFFKRLRKALSRGEDHKRISAASCAYSILHSRHEQRAVVRYYLGAEYGEQYRRPHYHICLFGIDFADKKYHCKSPTGAKLYRSDTLEKLWPMGFSTIGQLTFESAAYTARYVMKKINGERATQHYETIDHATGEILRLKPEYNNISKRPAIGREWIKKFMTDVYPHGTVIVRGKEANAPRYYDKVLKQLDHNTFDELKLQRELEARANWQEQTHERLRVREEVATAKTKFLKRKL